MEKGIWCLGREAEYFAREHDGILVDQLYQICCGGEAVQVGDEEMEPHALMAAFLEQALRVLGVVEPVRRIKCLVVTVEKLTQELVMNLQKACEALGFRRDSVLLQDYQESFYYYTMSQKPEYTRRKVAWYDFTPSGVHFRRMSMAAAARPAIVTIDGSRRCGLSSDVNLRDLEFYQFIEETMVSDVYSSVFLTGQGFSRKWADKSVTLLCAQRRKVFYGTNLYARGAVYAAREKLETHSLQSCLYLSDAMVRQNIGMDMLVMGSPTFHVLLRAGGNWYESHAECELILDHCDSLIFTVSGMFSREKRRISMSLPGLPLRPDKTTRLRLEMQYESVSVCRVRVCDLGFGEMYPSSGHVWTERIEMGGIG